MMASRIGSLRQAKEANAACRMRRPRFRIPEGSRVWYHDLDGHYEGQHTNNLAGAIEKGQWVAPPMTFRAAGARRLCVDHGGGPGELQRDGVASERPREFTLALANKQPPSHPFVMRYTKGGCGAALTAGIGVGHGDDTVAGGNDGREFEHAGEQRYFAKSMSAAGHETFSARVEDGMAQAGRARFGNISMAATASLDGTKDFCKMAAQLGFQYNVIEGYWGRWSDAEITNLVAYANQHGVRLLVWKHSRMLRTPEAREEFFKSCTILVSPERRLISSITNTRR